MDTFDIARLAGVSRKTVQRVLNNSAQVKAETRERILAIMNEHNYHPNVSARRLTKQKTHTLGLFIIQDPAKHNIYADDQFYSVVIGSMISASTEKGYNVLVTTADVHDPAPVLKLYREKSIDAGMIISWSNVQNTVDAITAAGFLVGVFDQNNLTHLTDDVPVPLLLNEEAAYSATRYLIESGHHALGMITGESENRASQERLSGFQKAMKESELSGEQIYHGYFIEQSGYEAIREWVKTDSLPSAIVCSNDLIAIGALKALHEHHIQVPQDVSLIGFDNIRLTEYTSPALTTMHIPRIEMATYLVHTLIDMIEESATAPSQSFHAVLTERQSCASRS
ncbi:LacI family DNA-binding transcriptional regulator [Jeotgalibacillus aurantiacus]|uniref:LacI family DNA-binding transcriptional regulator n=1 Tax=Jeotgalibacillus aurantiacus TaxID=2763266 RepID=UPI001D09EA7C|nr:LacI family DNA-binding transcriptional regulator [Jeotgalibacillus aurantiacus]